MTKDEFYNLYSDLIKKGYWCINAKTRENAFQTITDGISIRFAKRKNLIPNAEVKFAKNEFIQRNDTWFTKGYRGCQTFRNNI